MAREFVINPETGKVAVAITVHQDVERELLESALNEAEQKAADLRNQKLEAFNQTLLEDQEVVAADQAVAEAKSELGKYDEIAPAPAELDGGSAGSGSEAEGSEELVEADTVPLEVF